MAALVLHLTCLALFGLFVVWPVVSPVASGELEREFKPVLEALAAWQAGAAPARDAGNQESAASPLRRPPCGESAP